MGRFNQDEAADYGYCYDTTPIDQLWTGFCGDSDYPPHILFDIRSQPILGDDGHVALPVLPHRNPFSPNKIGIPRG